MQNFKNYKVCFIGHRFVSYLEINKKLKEAILNEITLGCRYFTMGTHGNFDELALTSCREFKEKYKDIEIEVVITSFNKIKKQLISNDTFGKEYYTPYSDLKTIMYNIEETHFKRKIIESNKKMIDSCNTLICYVNPNKKNSGAKLILNYAKRKGLKIVNIF